MSGGYNIQGGSYANAQNAMLGAMSQAEGMRNALAPKEAEPTLGTKLDQTHRRMVGLVDAIEQLREHLNPVLRQEPPSQNKDCTAAVDPGSPAMQALDQLMERISYCHQMVNDVQRRASL